MTAFIAATLHSPVDITLLSSSQLRHIFTPPALLGEQVIPTTSMMEKLLVEDMGGHGRALEILERVLAECRSETNDLDAVVVMNRVISQLSVYCPGGPIATQRLNLAVMVQTDHFCTGGPPPQKGTFDSKVPFEC